MEQQLLALVVITLVGVASQWVAWWSKLPAILFLLLAGIVLGPITGYLDPDAMFGSMLFPFISLGVAVVLFEGSLSLKLHEITGLEGVVRNLVTVGALLNWLVIALAAWLLMPFNWELAFLFGAMVVVTGPTVILPLLRTVRPNATVANILRWEGIVIDPLGALLAVLVFQFIISDQEHHPFLTFGKLLLAGSGIGGGGALLLAFLLRRHLMPEYLVNVSTLALVLGIYTLANHLQHESGLLAVTVMGMVLANLRGVPIREVVDFKESLSVMIISTLFILLAARIHFYELWSIVWRAFGVLLVIMAVARPLMVFVSTWRSKLKFNEKLLLSWIAPRGIVAAAVSALFALRLDERGIHEAQLLVPLTFAVIIGTVVIQSASSRYIANWLGLSEPEPRGVLIAGAHPVARVIGKALMDKGFPVVLADSSWDDISVARMEGLPTYFGNLTSEHADRHLDLVGIGTLLAMTRRPAFNLLACLRYKREFGGGRVYSLRTSEERDGSERKTMGSGVGDRLFGADVTLTKLASMIGQGGEVRTTHLTESFNFDAWREKYGKRAIPLFAITPKGRLRLFSDHATIKPEAGWRIMALLPSDALESGTAEREQQVVAD